MAMVRWSPFVSMERWEPFRGVPDIHEEVNRLLGSFLERPTSAADVRSWTPALDMHETKDEFVLKFELPGVKDKDVSLSIVEDVLTVKGERAFAADTEGGNARHIERVYGKFERSVQLPMLVQAEKVTANYRDGVLEVKLPKAEEVKPKAIKIDIG
jgi:HSP20 family protein